MKYRCNSPRAVCGIIVLMVLVTVTGCASLSDFKSEYEKNPPAKAIAIAGDEFWGWAAGYSVGQVNVEAARADALARCRIKAGEVGVSAECRIYASENKPYQAPYIAASPSTSPAVTGWNEFHDFPHRITELTHVSKLSQHAIDWDVTKCGDGGKYLIQKNGVTFVSAVFISCMRHEGYVVNYDTLRESSDCEWIRAFDSSTGYHGELRCGSDLPQQAASQPSPITKTPAAIIPAPAATRPKPVPSKLVRDVQEGLRKLGYSPGAVDGLLGPNTVAAVKAFQRDLEVTPTGAVSEELLFALNVVVAVKVASELKLVGGGSGFFVNNKGYALTNYHVVKGCTAVKVLIAGESQKVKLAATDESNDLALLKLPETFPVVAQFPESRRAILGEFVLAAGFPLKDYLATGLKVSTGVVSALAGIGDDPRFLQISAPVQPGNSGGPLLDKSATIIGVVKSKLDDVEVWKATGHIPQNVNFAIKGVIARGFLDIYNIEYDTSHASNVLETTEIAAAARKFTVPVECWK